jgi:hypothetical protein
MIRPVVSCAAAGGQAEAEHGDEEAQDWAEDLVKS